MEQLAACKTIGNCHKIINEMGLKYLVCHHHYHNPFSTTIVWQAASAK
jgi:hypothetical protein